MVRNWIFCGGCASEELRVVLASLDDWMANSSPPSAAFRALMACRLVVLDKRPGVRPVGIGETLRRALAKLIMRAAGEQAKTACGNLQLSADLEDNIEGSAHALGQRMVQRVRARRGEGESKVEEARVEPEEEVNEDVAGLELNNLRIYTAVTKEEEEEGLEVALRMEVEGDRGSEGEEEGGGNLRAL